ncbi:hypothetical protein G210_5108 [Candida maltosa Xu316]|uniref:AB hydrolase-1 domain-containing protein n=1 Tax=Candida maltosa (strain Xu316) TaxID=1245528 RepID=M3JCM3_CANMX|nr:hypothetical protein G210_5108 [Candida maltosa Xu316]
MSKESVASSSTSINSIPLLQSVQDWWSSPRSLMYDTTDYEESEQLKQDKLRNRMIEYELFSAMLPSDIHILPPNQHETSTTYPIFGQLLDVKLKDGNTIHEFYLENNTDPATKPQDIVIIHGYMAAMGYFIKNVESLIRIPGIRLHLIDLPGFGNSSRPKFPDEFIPEPESVADKIHQVLQIENWFIDKIEDWRLERNISSFKLIGHSMGGYLSCCYLLKYNKNGDVVKDVILVSPMGTESNESSLINDEQFQINLHSDPFEELQFVNKEGEEVIINEEITQLWKRIGQPRFPKNWILQKLWSTNKSPFEILQFFGPLYSKILSYWSFKRFKNFSRVWGSGNYQVYQS